MTNDRLKLARNRDAMRGRSKIARVELICPQCQFMTRFANVLKKHYKEAHRDPNPRATSDH